MKYLSYNFKSTWPFQFIYSKIQVGSPCWDFILRTHFVSDTTSPIFIHPFLMIKSMTSALWRCVLGKVLSGQRQTQIPSQSRVIDGRWRSGRRVWRCPWGGKFSEKPGQSGLFFRPIRNHKDMHLDSGWSGIDEDWHGWQFTIAVYLHLYQLIILGLSTGWRDFQDIHHLKP